MVSMNRRSAIKLGLASAATVATVTPAQALLRIVVSGSDFQPLPIAIPAFSGIDPQLAADATRVVTDNLRRSGLFVPLDPATYPVAVGDINSTPNFEAWRGVGADGVVMGEVRRVGAEIQANVRLWDAVAGEQMFGSSYATGESNWRRIAHKVSDAVYSALTGEGGYFDSRVVYVAESGPKANRRKQLAMMDSDGANVQYLTSGDDLVLTPRFSPNNRMLSYVSYVSGNPQVFLLEIATGQQRSLGNIAQMTFSPRFSPDGGRIAFSMTNGGNTDLLVMETATGRVGQLSSTAAIDTSPSFSPDGSQIVFESDRGGSQQLYIMAAGGGGAQRISFGEGIYSTPVWSPTGDLIAFTRKSGDEFSIGTMRPDGSGERILTSGFHNEGPTWAPNGRVLMFFRDLGGSDGPRLYTIDVWGRNEQPLATQTYASDPTWSPLLS